MAVDFPSSVASELARARAKHRPMHSPHEGYAVLLEELDELWVEVKAQRPSHERLRAELVQIGAMAQRMAEDEGVIVGRAEHISGCDTYGVVCKTLKDGAPQAATWLDEPRLTATGERLPIIDDREVRTGADDVPQRTHL